jgi:hypothetical protein
MKCLCLTCLCAISFFVVSPPVIAADANAGAHELPAPWKQTDLGLAEVNAPKPLPASPAATRPAPRATVPGSATFADGVFQVQGTMDLWGVADGCHFVYQPTQGDVELVARVTAMENPGGVAHAKASLLIRGSVADGSPGVTFAVTATDGTQLLHRDEADAKTSKVAADAEAQKKLVAKGTFPIWLKLVRAGDLFIAYESKDGKDWQKSGEVTVKLPREVVVGIAASSHKPDVTAKATFDHVTVNGMAKTPSK